MCIQVIKLEQKFTVVPNSIIQNESLSAEARCLWVYLASLPSDWRPYMAQLGRALGFGRDKMQRVVKELEDVQALRRTHTRGSDGRATGMIWELGEIGDLPENKAPGSDCPPKQPPAEKSGTIQKKQDTKETLETKERERERAREISMDEFLAQEGCTADMVAAVMGMALKDNQGAAWPAERTGQMACAFIAHYRGNGGKAQNWWAKAELWALREVAFSQRNCQTT